MKALELVGETGLQLTMHRFREDSHVFLSIHGLRRL